MHGKGNARNDALLDRGSRLVEVRGSSNRVANGGGLAG
jgi:hypothetical protein